MRFGHCGEFLHAGQNILAARTHIVLGGQHCTLAVEVGIDCGSQAVAHFFKTSGQFVLDGAAFVAFQFEGFEFWGGFFCEGELVAQNAADIFFILRLTDALPVFGFQIRVESCIFQCAGNGD